MGPWRKQRLTDNGLQPAQEQAAVSWVDRFRQLSAKVWPLIYCPPRPQGPGRKPASPNTRKRLSLPRHVISTDD